MRDTSDMMEDALSEDTMMDCGVDGGGLEDLVDLASDVADSSPTIRDAAERLLTLLGVDEDDEDLLSSSEDEGVELDIDELDDDEESTRLLHKLAASLAEELKSQKKHRIPGRTIDRSELDLDLDTHPYSYQEKSPGYHQEQFTTTPCNLRMDETWGAGWDACAQEAVRYLVEDEGLPPQHPTVLAMKVHLEMQRERALTQYAA